MKTWCNLPIEILGDIFAQLDPPERAQEVCECMLVCKSWNRSAQVILYCNVKVDLIGFDNLVTTVVHRQEL